MLSETSQPGETTERPGPRHAAAPGDDVAGEDVRAATGRSPESVVLVERERATRPREWLGRALFEAALIVLSILGAYAVSEWRDARVLRQRSATVLASIRQEVEANLAGMKEANQYNYGVLQRLTDAVAAGATTIPPSVHPRGMFQMPPLVSTAWESAHTSDVATEIPFELMLRLGATYQFQARYERRMETFLAMMYQSAMIQVGNGVELPTAPAQFRGILRDHVGIGGGLEQRYVETLRDWDVGDASAVAAAPAQPAGSLPSAPAPSNP